MGQEQARAWTILQILQWTITFFQEKGIENPRLTAEILLAHALGTDRLHLYVHYDQPLEEEERTGFKALIRQRVQGCPTQYLTGKQEFWSLEFQVAPGVLIPRPETEHLVEAALKFASPLPAPHIVDVGTGSGIIAICLQHELPQAEIYACDLSEKALSIARHNAGLLLENPDRITFSHGDLLSPFAGMSFDLIVSNPPYISASEYAGLAVEVRDHEPKSALYAGEDGLDLYRRLIAEAGSALRPNGAVAVEIGYGQAEAVAELFESQHFQVQEIIQDYARINRVIVACQR